MSKTNFFLYLQLRSALRAYGVPWGTKTQIHPIVHWVSALPTRGLVSVIYTQLGKQTGKELPLIKVWTKDLASRNEEINLCGKTFCASKNPNHQLIHFKMRAYHTPLVWFHMKHTGSPNCDLCNIKIAGTFKQMMGDLDCPQ